MRCEDTSRAVSRGSRGSRETGAVARGRRTGERVKERTILEERSEWGRLLPLYVLCTYTSRSTLELTCVGGQDLLPSNSGFCGQRELRCESAIREKNRINR